MNKIDEMELRKMDQEYASMEAMNKEYLNSFVSDIKKMDRSQFDAYFSKPVKRKKPFKVRFSEFKEKLRKAIG